MLAGAPANPDLGAQVTVSVGEEGQDGYAVSFVRGTKGEVRRLLPFTRDTAWRALAPIADALTLAAGIILHRMPGRTTAKHYLAALGRLIASLIGVLLVAGFLAP